MLGHVARSLSAARRLFHRLFLLFGLHCATHQIRLILISGVVITSLFYPALALYSSSQPRSFSLADLFSPHPTSASNVPNDLVDVWTGYDALRKREDSVSIATCGVGHTLRVERILIQAPVEDDENALNHRILLSTLDLEQRLQTALSSGPSPCLKRSNGSCFVISPLAFWTYDKDALLSDTNILDTLTYPRNASISGVLITPQMVLAGRGSDEHHVTGSKFDYANYLAITYFFPDRNCVDNTGHQYWEEAIKTAASGMAKVDGQRHPPTIIALEYDTNLSLRKGWTALSAFLYFAYFGFFAYVAWSMRQMDALHDRWGVTFTALVEIAVSTITSLSVCALVGFQVNLVPWELLPIVIAFVGAENMFNLIDAVGKTPVTLSVKQRIAEGLSHAGTSNTLKVVSYNCILGIMGGIGSGAVRQFCWFAIVVLVAHWFLAHTFFITVLSIDIQRLELEELLRRDTSLAPSLVRHDSHSSKQPRSGWARLGYVLKRLLKGRATTNISLLLLLAITATLYYTTYSTNVNGPQTQPPLRAVTGNHLKTPTEFNNFSPGWQLWKTLTPEKPEAKSLHIRIEQPFVVTLLQNHSPSQNNRIHRTQSWATFRLAVWLLKIMVLPIAATTGLLWLLLLYLLKDAELLEAQRGHVDSNPSEEKSVESLQGQMSFSTLPRSFSSDVELIASSRDGQIIVSVGLQNEITVWNLAARTHMSINATNLLLRTASSSHASPTLSSVAVEENGDYFAVGTGSGMVAVWRIDKSSIKSLVHLSLENSSAGVTDLQFGKPMPRYATESLLHPNLPNSELEDLVVVLATFENGVAAKWTINEFATLSYVKPTQNAIISNVLFVRVAPENQVLIAFAFDDGSLELVETGDTLPIILPNYHIRPGSRSDLVSHVHACRSELNGTKRLVVATATESGVVSLWDGSTGECISVLEEATGRVTHLRVSPIRSETCHYCGQLPLESVSIAYSIDYVVRFFMLYLRDQTRRCSCTRKRQQQLKHASSSDHLGMRSRSNSGTSSQMGSPRIPRARLVTAFETPAFPVSGHGVHQRRVSEKEPPGRRSSELFLNISPVVGSEDHELLSPVDGTSTPVQSPVSFWRNAVAVLVTEITCERGEWDVLGREYVGIRRRPRSLQGKMRNGGAKTSVGSRCRNSVLGLTSATLERWEVWTFDPVVSQMRSSVLVALVVLKPPGGESSGTCTPTSTASSSSLVESVSRLPFTRVTSLCVASSECVFAGFGNTIGVMHYKAGL